jgi:hypothetical protein
MGAQHNTPMHAAQHAPSGSVSATAVHVTDETHIDTRIPTRCIPEAYIHTRARVHTQTRTHTHTPVTHGMTRSSRRSGIARSVRHTITRCCVAHRWRARRGKTSASSRAMWLAMLLHTCK